MPFWGVPGFSEEAQYGFTGLFRGVSGVSGVFRRKKGVLEKGTNNTVIVKNKFFRKKIILSNVTYDLNRKFNSKNRYGQ